jgi:murein L,D-transpeptidase YcbB/YkuD
LSLFSEADAHGLAPNRYALDVLNELIPKLHTPGLARRFDELLTAALWTYCIDLVDGQTLELPQPLLQANHKILTNVFVTDHPADHPADHPNGASLNEALLKGLARAIKTGNIDAYINAIAPKHPDYTALQATLDTYRGYELSGGWPNLQAGAVLMLGSREARVAILRRRLELTDALQPTELDVQLFDTNVDVALRQFQRRHGLEVDGRLGPATLAALNVPATEKIRRISLNLNRWRQLPRNLPANHIIVNIPEFQLRLYRDSVEALSMRVVVGTKRYPTPLMHEHLRHLVFNPYWYPPRKIAVREILPRLQKDPAYLDHARMEVLEGKTPIDASAINWHDYNRSNFPYRFRQLPGENNSLGEVKFIFPNKRSIYLHDTPARALFSRRVRAFSHGCVRVEKPLELATALMAWDRGWTEADVVGQMVGSKRHFRKLKETMEVYLVYFTVSTHDGLVNFHPDIYGHDQPPQPADTRPALVATTPPLMAKVTDDADDVPLANR